MTDLNPLMGIFMVRTPFSYFAVNGESSSKYLKMFEDMDRNREKLVPGEATEEKNKSTNVDENSGLNLCRWAPVWSRD